MNSKQFKQALRDLDACRDARGELRRKTLRHFWQNTDRTDWMMWLIVRVGLWGRVSRYSLWRMTAWEKGEREWWDHEDSYNKAIEYSCCYWLRDSRADHLTYFRKRVSVEDLAAAIRKTIEKEARR